MNVITTRNLRKIYPNGVEAVRDISLSVREGEVLGFLGPNGAGKSTCIKMFTGLLRPTDGELEVLGYSLPDEWKEIAEKIGYVPQDLVFYPHLTVEENFRLFGTCMGIDNLNSRVNELASLFGLNELMKRRSSHLSGGQKRRLNVALGFLSSPDLLILDEPSAGMDPQSRALLWESLERIRNEEDITIILTTHLMETADRLSDRVAIINEGSVVAIDSPDVLKRKYSKGEIIEIHVIPPKIRKLVTVLNEHEDWIITSTGKMVSVSLKNALDYLPEVFNLVETTIGREGISSLNIRSNTLEDVFLTLTGRTLEEKEQ